MSTVFDSPKVAGMLGNVIFIAVIYAGWFVQDLSPSQKTAFCLLGPSCFMVSLDFTVMYVYCDICTHIHTYTHIKMIDTI